MTADEFRSAALACMEAVESGHMGKADFRIRKKIFATLDENASIGTLKLQPEQQDMLIAALGDAVFPASGSWGAKGWTQIRLTEVTSADVTGGLRMAWTNAAPKTLVKALGTAQ